MVNGYDEQIVGCDILPTYGEYARAFIGSIQLASRVDLKPSKTAATDRGTTVNERQMLEDLLQDAEAVVAKIKARLAEQHPSEGMDVSASASTAIERVQSQKTSDDTGNY